MSSIYKYICTHYSYSLTLRLGFAFCFTPLFPLSILVEEAKEKFIFLMYRQHNITALLYIYMYEYFTGYTDNE